MNIALWIVQGLLAVAFLMAGFMKASQPQEKLAENMAWVNDFSASQVRLIGILEVLGAVGLILPAVTGVLPILTPLAAAGLALTMMGAAVTHQRRGETPMIGINTVLLVLALFVVYGRFLAAPIS
ncbi:MAG: DoxX family protein [Ardenticatenaceae bacterium]|nr:DoxX family protein [Ardenticatenaceae bacterium]